MSELLAAAENLSETSGLRTVSRSRDDESRSDRRRSKVMSWLTEGWFWLLLAIFLAVAIYGFALVAWTLLRVSDRRFDSLEEELRRRYGHPEELEGDIRQSDETQREPVASGKTHS